MATRHIPDDELARIRAGVSLKRLVEASGVALENRGPRAWAGNCPFHDDSEKALSVSEETNLWACPECREGGDVIAWVMSRDKVGHRHAVELLREGVVAGAPAPASPVKGTPTRRLPAPVQLEADDQALLHQVIDYYHATLKAAPEALKYLEARGLVHGELVERFKLGYANRTLGLRLPEKNRKAGAEVRARLSRLGILREWSGHEHFNGALIVPILDERGAIVQVYGRKITENLRKGTELHLHLPGPPRGVWNWQGIAASGGEVILAKSLIDAMSFWCAGHQNVTAAYGHDGFTADHIEAFKRARIERVMIAYDRNNEGERAAEETSARLIAAGMETYRIEFPKTMDANLYALKVKPAEKALGTLIRKASWLGRGKRDGAAESAPREAQDHTEAESTLGDEADDAGPMPPLRPARKPPPRKPHPAAKMKPAPILAHEAPPAAAPNGLIDLAPTPMPVREELPEPSRASPLPSGPQHDMAQSESDSEIVLVFADRRYRVRGWKKPLAVDTMKVNLLVSRIEHGAAEQADPSGGRFHVDTLDLYNAKARATYVKQAGIEICVAEDALKQDLGRILLKLEALQDAELASTLKKENRPTLSDDQREEALALLRDPDLIGRIRRDFASCGIVGEETNTVVGYLACVSRLLDRPLALIIQSSSAAGKSSLMDAILAMMPPEAAIRYSAMTGQSLYYMGATDLKHRILAIAEEEGAEHASYALKLLQSDGEVTIASTGKDPTTGLLVTQEYRVEGPVMLFMTTTAIDLDEELMNRCLVLAVNESREQTKLIHEAQRQRETLAGMLANEDRQSILAVHRNAQGLLERLNVVNPYAASLSFLDDKTRTRRDHMKYLALIRAIALLHQHQREIKTVEHRGQLVRYVEVTADDIGLANALAREVLGRTLDELPPQTRRLLDILHVWVSSECLQRNLRRSDLRLGRRQVRAITGWGDTQTKVHLSRLVELDYVIAHRVRWGAAFEYELLYDGEGEDGQRFVMGLADVSALEAGAVAPKILNYDAERSEQTRARSGRGRRVAAPKSDPGRGGEIAEIATTPTASEETARGDAESQDARAENAEPSYAEAQS
ncbi:MAG: toprim domain-containing protein [Hyphomonadaceae bacterium]|nr:toprim domain-containing protein [Hyphomonadaceae bacterium]